MSTVMEDEIKRWTAKRKTALLCFATYNLVRMGSLGGWWDAHHA